MHGRVDCSLGVKSVERGCAPSPDPGHHWGVVDLGVGRTTQLALLMQSVLECRVEAARRLF